MHRKSSVIKADSGTATKYINCHTRILNAGGADASNTGILNFFNSSYFNLGVAYRSGFTLAESMMVIVVVSLLVILAAMNLKGILFKNSFKSQVSGLVSAMEAASTSAVQTGKRYEVIIDIPRQSWLLREITSPDLSEVLDEEIIAQEDFGENCTISYVLFDDGQFTNQERAKFRIGRTGWQFGGIIVLRDSEQQFWSLVINRLSNIVRIEPGETQIVWPRSADELPF